MGVDWAILPSDAVYWSNIILYLFDKKMDITCVFADVWSFGEGFLYLKFKVNSLLLFNTGLQNSMRL